MKIFMSLLLISVFSLAAEARPLDRNRKADVAAFMLSRLMGLHKEDFENAGDLRTFFLIADRWPQVQLDAFEWHVSLRDLYKIQPKVKNPQRQLLVAFRSFGKKSTLSDVADAVARIYRFPGEGIDINSAIFAD